MEFNYPAVAPTIIKGEQANQIIVGEKPVNLVETIFKTKLVQPGNVRDKPELAPAIGKFYIDVLDQVEDTMDLIPLKQLPERWSLFAPYDPTNNRLLCYSMDGIAPSERSAEIQSVKCGQNFCDKARFHDRKPPECQNTITTIFYSLKWNVLVQIDFYRTGMSAWNSLSKQYQDIIAKSLVLNKPLENYIVRAGTVHKGTYIQLTLNLVTTDEDLRKYHPIINYYKDYLDKKFVPVQQQIATAVAAAATIATADVEAEMGEELPKLN